MTFYSKENIIIKIIIHFILSIVITNDIKELE
jgi:hypothetical protein